MIIPESYELIEKREQKDVASQAYLLRHKKTQARILVMENDDENKVFSIGFRTTPKDSTGVAHIIEHTVLCGSEKYPAKDPFVELVKGSLNTFLNAMTYPDKTVFPVASCNDKDFQNLMSVYMDAVFHPNIYHNPKLFMQEGWHYELFDKNEPLVYNGVVYNEMKGAYSSPDDLLNELITQALYPDTEYANDSGGFPEDIPSLTYEGFLDFHRRYYHPSNSYVYLYGNADMTEKLEWIDKEYFSKYDYLEIDSMPAYQPCFAAPALKRGTYGITAEESEDNNTYLAWARVLGDTSDPESCMAFNLLSTVLLDTPGAPVKQALIDAGIGEEVYGYYSDAMRQPYFVIVAKGANESQREEFERVIVDTIKKLIADGINKKTLLACLNNQEFITKEADFGSYPKGLIYGLDTMGYWLYDDMAAFENLNFTPIFDGLRKKIDTDFYEQILSIMFLGNTHGATVVLAPERGLNEKNDEKLAAKLAEIKAAMNDEELDRIIAETAELKEFQNTPSTQEELEKIPMLDISDISTEEQKLSNIVTEIDGCTVVKHDYFTSGIAYFSLDFDTKAFGMEEIPYLSLVAILMGMVDTKKHSYQELGDEIKINMGGFGIDTSIYSTDTESRLVFSANVKALKDQLPGAMELVREILCESEFTDKKRVRELLTEAKSRLSTTIIERGHSFASMRCGSYYNEADYINDIKGGISFYGFLDKLLESYDDNSQEIIEKIKNTAFAVINRGALTVSFTGTDSEYEAFEKSFPTVLGALPCIKCVSAVREYTPAKKNEGFKTSAMVNYVVRSGNFKLVDEKLEYTGALKVLKIWMGYEYLWVNIRVKGGAYGCFAGFSRRGDVSMASYRDPHVAQTSEIYLKAAESIANLTLSDRDRTKYILGAINEMDTPLSSARKGLRSMAAYYTNLTDEMLQKQRDQVLSTTQEDLRACAKLIAAALDQGYVCAVGAANQIEADKELFGEVLPLIAN